VTVLALVLSALSSALEHLALYVPVAVGGLAAATSPEEVTLTMLSEAGVATPDKASLVWAEEGLAVACVIRAYPCGCFSETLAKSLARARGNA
jgi:hypothetical protein